MALKRITTKEGEVYFVDAKTGERTDVDDKYSSSSLSISPNFKSFSKSSRFSSLKSIGQFISVVGWILFGAAILGIFVSFNEAKEIRIFIILGSVISLINGLLVVAIGQLITCIVSIEFNTYKTNSFLEEIIKK